AGGRAVPVGSALRAAVGGSWSRMGSARARVCSWLLEKPRSVLNSLWADDTQGNLQFIRCLNACSVSSGACETTSMVTSRAFRCGRTPLRLSAIEEQVGQPVA